MATYLATGGAGFIGSHIVEALIERGERVRVLDNFSSGSLGNLAHVQGRFEIAEVDIRNLDDLRPALVGVDYVIHQAALPSVHGSIADPASSHAVNATGTLNVLIAARDAGVRRVVYASSCAVYGDDPALPKCETMAPAPLSPYAVSKLTGEQYCQVFTHVYGLETVGLRYFNVFGPRQNPMSQYAAVIPKFIARLLAGESPVVFGDGLQSRDFIYVGDVARANLRACASPDGAGKVFNVGVGERHSLLALIAALQRITGLAIAPSFEPAVTGDIRDSLAAVERARDQLGFTAAVSLDEGLRQTVEFLRATRAREASLACVPAR